MFRILLLVATLFALVLFAGVTPSREPTRVHAASQTFNYTGGAQTYNVPLGVSRVMITAIGGKGANSPQACNSQGGKGGLVQAIVTVTGGTSLQVLVAGDGQTQGGFNGGGTGGNSAAANQGALGGGSSDVRVTPFSLASRIVVAGGGGGAGGCSVATGGAGGDAGSPANAGAIGTGVIPGAGGGGATTAGPGAGPPPLGTGGVLQGGTGATSAGNPPFGDGGGGGGGFFGGGGGGASPGDTGIGGGGGGGGGSNFVTLGSTVLTNGATASAASVTIQTLDPPAISKSFSPSSIAVNGLTNLTITLTNNNPAGPFSTLTGINFTDSFAAQGLVITTGAVTGSPLCAGTITATAGTSAISLANGTLNAGATCQIMVQVKANVGGSQVNTTSPVSAAESGPGGFARATLNVASTVPGIVKSFNPTSVQVGGTSTMTITLTNPNFVGMTGVAFTDNFAPLGLVITSAVPTGVPLCTGTITATGGTSLVSLTGGTMAANSTCQIVVTVQANIAGTQHNQIATLTSNEFGPGGPATADLTVSALPTATPPNTPTATPTSTPLPPIVVPVIPQVFQHVPQGIFTAPRASTPTPVRQAVAPVVPIDPGGIVVPVLRPPSTGDAGLMRVWTLPVW